MGLHKMRCYMLGHCTNAHTRSLLPTRNRDVYTHTPRIYLIYLYLCKGSTHIYKQKIVMLIYTPLHTPYIPLRMYISYTHSYYVYIIMYIYLSPFTHTLYTFTYVSIPFHKGSSQAVTRSCKDWATWFSWHLAMKPCPFTYSVHSNSSNETASRELQ